MEWQNKLVTHWRSEWIQALWSLVSCVWSLQGLFPQEPLQGHHTGTGWNVLLHYEVEKQEVVATVWTADSPTDCPAVYESVLVRERLLPLVFAVGQTGKVCEKYFFSWHYNYYSYFFFKYSILFFQQQHCSDLFLTFTKIEGPGVHWKILILPKKEQICLNCAFQFL